MQSEREILESMINGTRGPEPIRQDEKDAILWAIKEVIRFNLDFEKFRREYDDYRSRIEKRIKELERKRNIHDLDYSEHAELGTLRAYLLARGSRP